MTAQQARQRFIDGMSLAATSVNIVTTDGPDGRAGITVSAMSSVSADTPQPSLLVCIHHASRASRAIIGNGRFCVNLLRDDQSYISDVFAGRLKTPDGDRFSACEWVQSKNGTPRVRDALVAFHCRLDRHMKVGTHHVFFGAVEETVTATGGRALIYANRAYGSPTRLLADSTRPGDSDGDGERELRLGCLATFGPPLVPAMLARLQEDCGAFDMHLVEGDQQRLLECLRSGEIELAMLHDFDLADEFHSTPLHDLRVHVLMAGDDPLAGREELTLADLAGKPLVMLDLSPGRDYFLSLFRDAGLEPSVACRSSSVEMVRGLVGYGFGFGLFATRPAGNRTSDGRTLVCRPLVGIPGPGRLVLARRRDRTPGRMAAAFTDICRRLVTNGS
ncbi:MAG: flavin reductase [Geminicoccaceae bacterium]|nr:flavin reductase [Geminicoccaceae bacterium]